MFMFMNLLTHTDLLHTLPIPSLQPTVSNPLLRARVHTQHNAALYGSLPVMGMMKGMGQMGGGAQGGLMPGDGPPRSMRNGPKTAEQKRMEGIQNRMAEGRQYRGSSNTADAQADLLDPDLVRLHFEIDGVGSEHSGPVKILLHRSWSPIGVEHLAGLVRQRVYDGTQCFRVVPGFIVQF